MNPITHNTFSEVMMLTYILFPNETTIMYSCEHHMIPLSKGLLTKAVVVVLIVVVGCFF